MGDIWVAALGGFDQVQIQQPTLTATVSPAAGSARRGRERAAAGLPLVPVTRSARGGWGRATTGARDLKHY
uniref:Uncharacterized protein n=1 Tax=Oryza sativa subsp. japonica TaxID=39947 RepID=Q8GVT4_ORYSJ|nr:hypothetical protein [Oryza sativa Japonica Group]BAD31256.1 hypothetical protein [Oryza sativa Japonica Group]